MVHSINLNPLILVESDLKVVVAIQTDPETKGRVVCKHPVESWAIFAYDGSHSMLLGLALAYLKLSAKVDLVPIKTELFFLLPRLSWLPGQHVGASDAFSSLIERNLHPFQSGWIQPGMKEHKLVFYGLDEFRHSKLVVILICLIDKIVQRARDVIVGIQEFSGGLVCSVTWEILVFLVQKVQIALQSFR